MSTLIHIPLRAADLGEGFLVRRALPSKLHRMVGAWCFLDHAGPVRFAQGKGMHVGAHPHIGLQTFTWLMDGEVMHRDSLGHVQPIKPGQVNLMTAGRGIVHTEDSVTDGTSLHAAQLWIALPEHLQHCEPRFQHYDKLPVWTEQQVQFTLLVGELAGHRAPTEVHSPLLALELRNTVACPIDLPTNAAFEYAVLVLEGGCSVQGEVVDSQTCVVLPRGGNVEAQTLSLKLNACSRILVLGGEPFEQPVQMWWNFVAHSKEAIARAQADWEQGTSRFPVVLQANGEPAPRLQAPALPW
ncbi:MAG TPA: pirin family protein [Limnobacter sp.]|uniref:pirin family protein n=1 Tax=Limnobacter sp. TaxID=2003368 RepID=UPI002ED9A8E5